MLRTVFRDILKGMFKHKNNEQINSLLKATEDESNSNDGSKIEYAPLFVEDNEDHFLSLFKSFIKEERLGFANEIKESLASNR